MNKLITHKITLSIIFVIVCQFTAKAQDSAKKVIVVVRPGGITSTTTTTVPTAKTPTSTPAAAASTGSASKFAAAAPGAPASASTPVSTGAVKTAAVVPASAGSTPTSTGALKTVAVVPASAVVASVATPKPTPTPYVAPGSRPHTYVAPSTSERVGDASYMHKPVVSTVTTTTPAAGAASATPVVAGGNASKYAAAAPAAPVTVTPAVAAASALKKDTVVITKIQKDTVIMPPAKHMGNKIAFLEIGGPGLAISINYDQRFKKGSKDGLGFRAGVGYFAAGNNTVFTVPLMVNYLYGKDGKYLEIGLGTTFLNSKGDNYSSSTFEFDAVTGFIPTGLIGVRYEPNKALNFRLGYVPIIYDQGLINAGGFSIGYTF